MTAPAWHVLGAGAMGCLFASRLQLANCAASLILRPGFSSKFTTVTVEQADKITELSVAASTPSDDDYISHLLITTKAQDIAASTRSIKHRLDANSQVLVLSNGLGYAEELAAILPGSSCFFGATTEGAYRLGARHIRYAGQGITRIGHIQSRSPPDWFRHWSTALNSRWSHTIEEVLWHKFAINCAINPLTAVHGCLNGELVAPGKWLEVEKICQEIEAVSTLEGTAAAIGDLLTEVNIVVSGTAKNRSSMLQDVLAGRPTEIQYLTGYLLHRAKRYGISLPANRAVYEQVVKLNT
ncbi:MAG: 2-dehydropantoate 2-reductase [Pseudomonadota bacterium]